VLIANIVRGNRWKLRLVFQEIFALHWSLANQFCFRPLVCSLKRFVFSVKNDQQLQPRKSRCLWFWYIEQNVRSCKISQHHLLIHRGLYKNVGAAWPCFATLKTLLKGVHWSRFLTKRTYIHKKVISCYQPRIFGCNARKGVSPKQWRRSKATLLPYHRTKEKLNSFLCYGSKNANQWAKQSFSKTVL